MLNGISRLDAVAPAYGTQWLFSNPFSAARFAACLVPAPETPDQVDPAVCCAIPRADELEHHRIAAKTE
jgi:hypothetical protein